MDWYARTFKPVAAVACSLLVVFHAYVIATGFDIRELPFWADVLYGSLGLWGGLGLALFFGRVAHRCRWERALHALVAAYLLASTTLHAIVLVEHSHARFAPFVGRYSYFGLLYSALFASWCWTARLEARATR